MIEHIKKSNVVIYGSGYLAEAFLKILRVHSLENRVIGVVSTCGSQASFLGYRVEKFDEFDVPNGAIVCVCMHEMYKKEVVVSIEKRNLQYHWFHTNTLVDLICGPPIRRNIKKRLRDILVNKPDIYGIAVRWLAIDEYNGKNSIGFEIYRKYWLEFTNEINAKKREQQFKKMLESVKKKGFVDENPIIIDEQLQNIDGNHRLAVAAYLGITDITCDIYRDLSLARTIFGEKTFLTEALLEQSTIFSEEEKNLLRDTVKDIKEGL